MCLAQNNDVIREPMGGQIASRFTQMRREAFDFIVKHRLALEQKLDVMDLMSRILAGGPKMARTLAAIDVDVPSSQIPARFEPELMPFGKVFFLEIASPWSGTLDLRDDETMKKATAKGSRLKQWKSFHPAKFGTPVIVGECSPRIPRSTSGSREKRGQRSSAAPGSNPVGPKRRSRPHSRSLQTTRGSSRHRRATHRPRMPST
jgi:hypothetical protein